MSWFTDTFEFEAVDRHFRVVEWCVAAGAVFGVIAAASYYTWDKPYLYAIVNEISWSVGIIGVFASHRQWKLRYSSISPPIPWQFDPNTVQMTVGGINLLGLRETDPAVVIQVNVLNATGHYIELTGARGRLQCGSDSGLVDARLHARQRIGLPLNGSYQGILIEQVFSPGVGQRIIRDMREAGSVVGFECGAVSLLGESDGVAVELPLSRLNCYVKGPFSIENDEDQGAMAPLQRALFVSQYEYEHWSGNRKTKRSL